MYVSAALHVRRRALYAVVQQCNASCFTCWIFCSDALLSHGVRRLGQVAAVEGTISGCVVAGTDVLSCVSSCVWSITGSWDVTVGC